MREQWISYDNSNLVELIAKTRSLESNRLQDIKHRYMDCEYDFNLKREDIDYLIKQAETLKAIIENKQNEI